MAITDGFGRITDENISYDQMKSLLEAEVKPVLQDIKIGIDKQTEKYDKEIAKHSKETEKHTEKILDEIKSLNKDQIAKLVKKYLKEDVEGEVQEANKLLNQILNMMNSLNKTVETQSKSFDINKFTNSITRALSNVKIESTIPEVITSSKAVTSQQFSKLVNVTASGFDRINASLGRMEASLKDALPSLKEMALEAVHRGTLYVKDINLEREIGKLEGELKTAISESLNRSGQSLKPGGDPDQLYKGLSALIKELEKGHIGLDQLGSALEKLVEKGVLSNKQATLIGNVSAVGDATRKDTGGRKIAKILEEIRDLDKRLEGKTVEDIHLGSMRLDPKELAQEIVSAITSECIKICDGSFVSITNDSIQKLSDAIAPKLDIAPLLTAAAMGNKEAAREIAGMLKPIDNMNATNEILKAMNTTMNGIFLLANRASPFFERDCIKICEKNVEKEVKAVSEEVEKVNETLDRAQKSAEKAVNSGKTTIEVEDTKVAADIVKVENAVQNLRGEITDSIRYTITALNTAQRKIEGFMSSISESNPIYDLTSNKDLLRGEAKYRKELYEILFIQQGITATNRTIQKQYEMSGDTLVMSAEKWESIAKITGQDINSNLQNYLRFLKAGVKDQRVAEKLMKSAGSLATSIGVKADQTGEMFTYWNNQLKLSTEQSAQMSRNIQDIGRQTGLTGDNLLRAVKASEGLLKGLRNAATLSAETAKNFMAARAEAEKMGVGEEVDSILKAITSGADFINQADEGVRNILALSTGRAFGPGLFNEILMGRGGKKDNIKKVGMSFNQLVKDLVRDVGGVNIKSLDEIAALPDEVKLVVDNALLQMSKGKVRIGNIGIIAESLTKAGQSFAEQISMLDTTVFGKFATTQEKILASQQKQTAVLNENFRIQTSISEMMKARPAEKLSSSIEAAVAKLKSDIPDFGKELDMLGITADSGIEIVRESLEGLYGSLQKQLSELGKEGLLKVKKDQINEALADQTGKSYRQLLADLNEAQQALVTAQKATTDPMAGLAQEIKELNGYLRGFTGGAFSRFMDAVGKAGFILLTIIAGFGTIAIQLQLFEQVFGRQINAMLSSTKSVRLVIGGLAEKFAFLSGAVVGLSGQFVSFANAISNMIGTMNRQIGTLLGFIKPAVASAGGAFGSTAGGGARVVQAAGAFGAGRTVAAVETMAPVVVKTTNIFKSLLGYLSTFGNYILSFIAGPMSRLFSSFEGLSMSFSKGFVFMTRSKAFTSGLGIISTSVANSVGPLFVGLNKLIGPLAVVAGLFEGIANKNEKLGTGLNVLAGLFTGSTKIGSSNLGPDATNRQRKNAEAGGLGMAALQGATVGAFIGRFFGPIGLALGPVIGALAGVITEAVKIVELGGVLASSIKKAWETIQQAWTILADGFTKAAKIVIDPIMKMISGIETILGGGGGIDWERVITGFGDLVKTLSQVLSVTLQIVASGLAKVLESAWVFLKPLIEGVSQLIKGLWQGIQGLVSGNTKEAIQGIAVAFAGALKSIVVAVGIWAASIPVLILSALEGIATSIGEYFGKDSIIGRIFIDLGLIFKALGEYVKGIFNIVVGLVSLDFKLVGEGIKGIFTALWDGIVGITGTISNLFMGLVEMIKSLPGLIIEIFKSIDWVAIGATVFNGIGQIITSLGTYFASIDWGAVFSTGFQWLMDNWLLVITGIVAAFVGLPTIIGGAVIGIGAAIVGALTIGISDALGGFAEGIAKAIGPNTFLGRTVKWISDIFYGFAGILTSIGKLLSGDVMGALDHFGKSITSIFGFGFGGEGLKDQRNTDAANKAIDSFTKALDEGAKAITKSVEDVRKETFGSTNTIKTIAEAFNKQSKPLEQFTKESLGELRSMGLEDVAKYLKQAGSSGQVNRSAIFHEVKSLVADGRLSSEEMGKAASALRTYVENSKKLEILNQARNKQMAVGINAAAQGREDLQTVAQKFAQGQINKEDFGKQIWNFPNIARLSGMEAVDQTMKAILDVTKDGDVGQFLTDKKQVGILGASLTWEQKQAMLLEEANKYHKEAAKYFREGKIEDYEKAFTAALSARAAMEQNQRLRTASATIGAELSLGNKGVNWNNLSKKVINDLAGFGIQGPFDLPQNLNEVAQGKNLPVNIKKDQEKEFTSLINRAITQSMVSSVVGQGKGVSLDLVKGTTEQSADQLISIWREALTPVQRLSTQSAALIMEGKTQLERGAIAEKEYNRIMKEIKDRLIESKKPGANLQDITNSLNLLAADAAGIMEARKQGIGAPQEAARALGLSSGLIQGNTPESNQVKDQLTRYMQRALTGKSPDQALSQLIGATRESGIDTGFTGFIPKTKTWQMLAQMPYTDVQDTSPVGAAKSREEHKKRLEFLAQREQELLADYKKNFLGAQAGYAGQAQNVAEIVKELVALKVIEPLQKRFWLDTTRYDPKDFPSWSPDKLEEFNQRNISLLNAAFNKRDETGFGTIGSVGNIITQAIQSFAAPAKQVNPLLARQQELAASIGMPLTGNIKTMGSGTLIGVNNKRIPLSNYTVDELKRIISEESATNRLKGTFGIDPKEFQLELERRSKVSLDEKSSGVLTTSVTTGTDNSDMAFAIESLTAAGLESGSIYTHDVHVEKLLGEVIDRMDAIYVQTVAPNMKVNVDDEIRRKQIEDTASNTSLSVNNLEEIAEYAEENVDNTNKTNQLLAKVADALEAIKELLSPNQTGDRKNNRNPGRELYEEPFWDPPADTEYQYPNQESVGWGINSTSE